MQLLPGLISFFFIWLVSPLGAQVKGSLVERSLDLDAPFTILTYSTKQGLPQNQVVDILSKKNGSLFLSTGNGIVEYNGSEIKSFIRSDAYKENAVWNLYWHEKTGQLIGQHSDGAARILYPANKLLGAFFFDIHDDEFTGIDQQGRIWKADVKTFQLRQSGHSHIRKPIRLFYHDRRCYISTEQALYVYDEQSQETKLLASGTFVRVAKNPYTQELYALETKGVYKINGRVQKIFDTGMSKANCHDMAFTETGTMYIATTEGLYEKGDGYTNLYDKKNLLPSQHLQSLYYSEADRCLYVGSGEKGLLRLQFKSCYTYTSQQGLPESCSFSSLVKTSAGEILMVGACGDIYSVMKDTVYRYNNAGGMYSSMASIDGKIYMGTWGQGLKVLNNKKNRETIHFEGGRSANCIFSVYKDSRGEFWMGTGAGLARGKSIHTMEPFLKQKIRNNVITIYEGPGGNLYIGGSEGLFILDPARKTIKHLGQKQGLTGREVRALYEDKKNRLWIGTYDGGIYCYANNRLTGINRMKNAMLDSDAFCFAPDTYGYFYISSNHGLWRISEKDLNDFYEKKIGYLVPFFYSEEDGLVNTEFNGGFQNNYLVAGNRIFFPNLQGLVYVTPKKPVFRKLRPVIDRVYVNDVRVDSLREPLPRNTGSVRFDFSGNSFLGRYNIYYQYRISRNKATAQWSPLQKSGTVNFNSLQPGKYTFTLRAIDAFNDRDPAEVTYTFEIRPYFYETAWFIIVLCITFLGITIFVGRLRVQMYRRKAEEKERHKRRLAELELKAVHDRMNPHFVFNSLNSIKYYLSVNDRENANKYLDGFSVLLRKFTEYSSQNFISVREEMDIISTYVQLEKMRMNHSFRSQIEVDPQTLDQLIPTINIQPFVENAIKHGLAHLSTPGLLKISITPESGNRVKCVIEDNGIGRKRSQEINAGRKKHVSSGIKLVEEKKQIMEALYNIGISIHIEDKTNAAGEPAGTIVTLKIPVKND